MARIKVTYTIQSCPKCQRELLRIKDGVTRIGSPLVTCRGCGTTYRTTLREEWYKYTPKIMVILWPLILGALMLFTSCDVSHGVEVFLARLVGGVLGGFIFGLIFCIPNFIRILLSKRRMKDLTYLMKLVDYKVITWQEYEQLRQKAKK